MTRLYCDGPTLMRAVAAAVANLAAHVEEVDSLNVFPVPDGDTGSNMLATMRAALGEAEKLPPSGRDLHAVAAALSRGALSGARGNSGVILSQIIRGMTSGIDGRRRVTGLDLAQGLRRGSEVAYGAVLRPVEGTILTVIRDAAEAAERAADGRRHVEGVLAATIEAAARSVERTPRLLPILEAAGVVDSGGQGLYRLLEGTMRIDGALAAPEQAAAPPEGHASAEGGVGGAVTGPGGPIGEGPRGPQHGYEIEYLVTSPGEALDLAAIGEALRAVADSVVVAGDPGLARVHAHGERPDLALGVGLAWGRVGQVRIHDLDEQVSVLARRDPTRAPAGDGPAVPARSGAPVEAPAVALVAIAPGDGFARAFRELGSLVVRQADGARPSVGDIAAGILASGARDVIVLPNDADAILAARQAQEMTPLVSVHVVPTRDAAEGIAAALAFDPNASLGSTIAIMGAEAQALRSFGVTRAARDSVVDGRAVRAGQAMALDASRRRLLACEEDPEAATLRVLETYDDFDLVTCWLGKGLAREVGDALRARIGERGWDAEVELLEGGQPHELLLVAVE